MKAPRKTETWFDEFALGEIFNRYAEKFWLDPLSYATAEDFCDSFDHLRPLATANGDLKDVQRPWMLKAILGAVPRGGRLLEIGAGEPWVADLLSRLGYDVWIVDPYDGSGNGPSDYELFSEQCPDIRFIRDNFSDRLPEPSALSLDCVYSISVLEHVPPAGLRAIAAGIRKFLKPDGVNLHAVDHVHRGNGAAEHLSNLRLMVELFGLSAEELARQLRKADLDTETYFLSAESHNRWRGSVPYKNFPMRVCISVQMLGQASASGRILEQS